MRTGTLLAAGALLALLVLRAGAAGSKPPAPDLAALEQRFVEMQVGEERHLFTDAAAWRAFWQRFDASAPVPAFDFGKHALAVFLMGVQPSGGHSVRISEVRGEGGASILRVLRCRPPPDAMSISVMTAPHAVAVVSRSARTTWAVRDGIEGSADCR